MLREERTSEQGFSLIEMLVSMSIIGVLSGLSMGIFSAYQADAYNSLALTHLKSVILGEEGYYTSADAYVNCENDECLSLLKGVAVTPTVKVQALGDEERYTAAACSPKGNRMYTFDSETSSLQAVEIELGSCNAVAPDLY